MTCGKYMKEISRVLVQKIMGWRGLNLHRVARENFFEDIIFTSKQRRERELAVLGRIEDHTNRRKSMWLGFEVGKKLMSNHRLLQELKDGGSWRAVSSGEE